MPGAELDQTRRRLVARLLVDDLPVLGPELQRVRRVDLRNVVRHRQQVFGREQHGVEPARQPHARRGRRPTQEAGDLIVLPENPLVGIVFDALVIVE